MLVFSFFIIFKIQERCKIILLLNKLIEKLINVLVLYSDLTY